MGEWVIGALINLFGSIAINFGTNLLKLGHNERERHSTLDNAGPSGKMGLKPIIYFQAWRVGLLVFFLGNCLNFISFGYAAQSLLAALGSVQFVSNIAFAYFVFNRTVTFKVLAATGFIVLGNIFLVSFGNHQSPVYTPGQLEEKYSNITFVLYCTILMFVVALYQYVYRRGELLLAAFGRDLKSYWKMLLPFSYAVVSGAIGSFSVLFAKSLSNLLRLAMSSSYSLHSWFTYSLLVLFLCTAGFWMTRLNEGLSLFDAIVIVPMFQIVWTFFSIFTGFVYFQEYQVFDALKITMFILGMISVFVGISLLAPDESKGSEVKENSPLASAVSSDVSEMEMYIMGARLLDNLIASYMMNLSLLLAFSIVGLAFSPQLPISNTDGGKSENLEPLVKSCYLVFTSYYSFHRLVIPSQELQHKDTSLKQNKETRTFMQGMGGTITEMMGKAKTACSMSLGFGEDSINASAVLVMPMVSSKMTGFRGSMFDQPEVFSLRNSGWSKISMEDDGVKVRDTESMLPQTIGRD